TALAIDEGRFDDARAFASDALTQVSSLDADPVAAMACALLLRAQADAVARGRTRHDGQAIDAARVDGRLRLDQLRSLVAARAVVPPPGAPIDPVAAAVQLAEAEASRLLGASDP